MPDSIFEENEEGLTQLSDREECSHNISPKSDCAICLQEDKDKKLKEEESDGQSNGGKK